MKIEKLTENKIRITLNVKDLDENNIDLHSFMANSLESQDLFYTMLEKAEKEIGFNTDDYRLMIEAIAVPNGNFVLTITRMAKENVVSNKKKVTVKRRTSKFDNEFLIYKFNSFDNFCEFCNYLKLNAPYIAKNKLKNSKFYLYNSEYYLCFSSSNINIEQLKILHYMLLEFSEYIHNSKLFQSKLNEYGKLIVPKNTINLVNKYF